MIGSLLYLYATRHDIMYSVCVCARYQADPKISHLKAVKRIIKYISGTIDLGIWFSKDTNTNLVGFSDADWVSDRKSTSCACFFFLGNNLVSWYIKKKLCFSIHCKSRICCCMKLLWLIDLDESYAQ